MIKNIAVALVSYNGKLENEIIYRVTELNKIDSLKVIVEYAKEIDKKNNVKSEYRIEIFSN